MKNAVVDDLMYILEITEDSIFAVIFSVMLAYFFIVCQIMLLFTGRLFFKIVIYGIQHSYTTVACSASSKSDYKVSATMFHGIAYQLSHTISCGGHWIAFRRFHEIQSAGFGSFNYCRSFRCDTIFGGYGTHKRIVNFTLYYFSAQNRTECLEHAFTTVGYRYHAYVISSRG